MKLIKLNPKKIKEGITISQQHSPVEVKFIAPSTYVIIDSQGSCSNYAFESPNLARFFKQTDQLVDQVWITDIYTVFGTSRASIRELHLRLDDGQSITLSESEKINLTLPFKAKYPESASIYAPSAVWDIAPNNSYGTMLLTGRLVDAINAVSLEGQQTDILNSLWRDYTAAIAGTTERPDSIDITGEFLDFSVAAINEINLFDFSID